MRGLDEFRCGVHTIRQTDCSVVVELNPLVNHTDSRVQSIHVDAIGDDEVRMCRPIASSLAEMASPRRCGKFTDDYRIALVKQIQCITPHSVGLLHFGFANSVVVAGDLEHPSRFARWCAERRASADATHHHRESLFCRILRLNEHIHRIRKTDLADVAAFHTATNVRDELPSHRLIPEDERTAFQHTHIKTAYTARTGENPVVRVVRL